MISATRKSLLGLSRATLLLLLSFAMAFTAGAGTQITVWGNHPGEAPTDLGEVRGITAGSVHCVAVNVNGQVTAWGANYNGETNVPFNLGPVIAVSAGDGHTLALKSNGTVGAWGFDGALECQVPPGLGDVAAVSAGGLNSLALKRDGTLVAWGYEAYGQTNVPPDLINIVAIAVGGTHSLALRPDGTVTAWGGNDQHQTDVPPTVTNAVAIAAGLWHSLALTAEGKVIAWGNNSGGQTNVPADLANVTAVAAGENYSLALKRDGTLVAWGSASSGETNIPPGLSDVVAIAAGGTFCMALTGGTRPYITSALVNRVVPQSFPTYFRASAVGAPPLAFQWKFNGIDLPGATDPMLALQSTTLADQGWYSLVVSNSFGVGESEQAWLEVAPLWIRSRPRSQAGYWGNPVTFAVEVVSATPVTYQWQFNGMDLPGETNRTLVLPGVQPADAGYYAVVVRNSEGSVRSADAELTISQIAMWGFNPYFPMTNVPPNLTNVLSIACGYEHSIAVLADGSLVEWGDTANWPTHAPPGLNDVVSAAAGGLHSLALRSNGTVVGWGDNASGQVNIPATLSNVVAVAAGSKHSLALKADGSVVAWGDNSARQTNVPPSLGNVVSISAGQYHNLAVKADGSVTAWGGSTYHTNIPPALTNAVAVAGSSSRSLALTADGRVFVWGQAGSETTVPPSLTNVVAIAGSADHFVALKSDGEIVVWGNDWAQMNPPGRLSGVVELAAGDYTSMALIGAGPPVFTLSVTNLAGVSGRSVYLRTGATGALPMTYQWRFNGVDIAGATEATLQLQNVQFDQAGLYTVVVGNAHGTATNLGLHLTVLPLMITSHPASQTLLPGSTAGFDVGVIGQAPLHYQWQFKGVDLASATNSNLVIPNVQFGDAGPYAVIVSNDLGSVRSANALLSISSIIAWGTNNYGQLNVPPNLTNVVVLAAGQNHSLALRDDGTVAAWGDNRLGQTSVPAGLNGVIFVAAGNGNHSLALKSDGTVVAWGLNTFHQADVPAGLKNVVAIAAGGSHSLALKADGSVVAWGSNAKGQTNVPAGLTSVVAVAAMSNGSAALRADGTVVTWGTNDIFFPGPLPLPSVQLTNVISITGGASLAGIRPNGTGVVWGGSRIGYYTPVGFTNLIALSGSANQYMGLKTNGTVVTDAPWFLQQPPTGLTNIALIAAGSNHGVAAAAAGPPIIASGFPDRDLLMGSTDYFWVSASGSRPLSYQWQCNGTNIVGATGALLTLSNVQSNRAGIYSVIVSNSLGVAVSRQFTVNLAPLWITNQPQNVSSFVSGNAIFSVRAAGPAPFHYQWQFNGADLPGATSSSLVLTGLQVTQAGAYAVKVSNSYGALMSTPALLSINRVVAWGDNSNGLTNVPAGLSNAVAISAGIFGCTALKEDGTVLGWGKLGITNVPAGLSNVVAISCGSTHALALKSDSTVVGWGSPYNVPEGLTNVIAITAGESYFSAALLQDGTVRAWGDNSYGLIDLPPNLMNVVMVSSRRATHALALRDDGTVAAWGYNDSGQTDVPRDLTNAVFVSAANYLSLALREDGTVVAWGNNDYGQTNVPPALSNVVRLKTDGFTVVAQKADGTVVVWGQNWYGQTNVPRSISNVVDVAVGGSCVALKQDGRIATWGATLPGQTVTSLLRNVIAVDTGNAYLALLGDEPPVISRTVANPHWSPSEFAFSFPTERGRVYLVEFKDALTDRTWTAFPLVRGNGRVHTWKDLSALGPNRFYRVLCW